MSKAAFAQPATVELPIVNGKRNVVAFPEKRPLIVLTTRPPQLETPFDVFNDGLITPNDAFFVRYHNAGVPTSIDGDKHVIKIGGNAVGKPFELTLPELKSQFKPVEVVAVNQCSGNSRGAFLAPRHGRATHQRRHGQRALGRRAAEGRAGARRIEEQLRNRSPSTGSIPRCSAAAISSRRSM